MVPTYSSNVILAKARAMYGRRLTRANYRELLECRTVGEVASYLKNQTSYGSILAGINESDIHRGQLEIRLRQKLFEDNSALCRYEVTIGEHFANYLISRGEIEQILHSLVLLEGDVPEEYLFAMPAYLTAHTHLDLTALSHIRSYDDLLLAVAHTPYRKALESFRPAPGVPLNYTGIENALYTYLYGQVFEVIRKYTRGETAAQLRQMFESYIDLQNYLRIARLRFIHNEGIDVVRSALLPFGHLHERHLNALLEAQSQEELASIMRKTPVGMQFIKSQGSYAYVEQLMNRTKYRICRRDIRFSTHPSVVLMSYIFLMEIEVGDIITIVEGIRYQLAPDEIKSMLTVVDF